MYEIFYIYVISLQYIINIIYLEYLQVVPSGETFGTIITRERFNWPMCLIVSV